MSVIFHILLSLLQEKVKKWHSRLKGGGGRGICKRSRNSSHVSNIFICTLPFADVSERFGEVDQILVRESDGGLHQRPVGHSPITRH